MVRRVFIALLCVMLSVSFVFAGGSAESTQNVLREDPRFQSLLDAYADIEPFQKVQEYLGVLENSKNYVENQLSLAEEMKRSASEGVGNVVQKINEVKSEALSPDEELLNKVSNEIPDVNNIDKATEQVEKAYNRQGGQGNDNQVAQEQNEKMMDVQRENVANLYAVAFTTRTLLAKERQKDVPENDMKDTRELIKLTNQKAAEMLRRLRNIMKLEAAMAEFKISQQAIAYSVKEAEDKTPGGEE